VGGRSLTSASETPGGAVREQVRRYLDHLATERGLAVNSVSAYRRDLRRYLEHLSGSGVRTLADVEEQQIAGFLDLLLAGDGSHPPLAAASAARAVVTVRGLHRFAQRQGLVAQDVSLPIRPPVTPPRRRKTLTAAEVEALIRATDPPAGASPERTALCLRDRALLELLYGTGARISEAGGLDLTDVSVGEICAPVVRLTGPGGRTRVVPVGEQARAALQAYLSRGRPSLVTARQPALFLSVRGRRLSRQAAWLVLRGAAERAALHTSVSPHVLRHTCAEHLRAGGADDRVVQELLGQWSGPGTLASLLVTPERLHDVYRAAHPRARK
jgi:integrase/recombinase XerD